jgi:hypothetical protein
MQKNDAQASILHFSAFWEPYAGVFRSWDFSGMAGQNIECRALLAI